MDNGTNPIDKLYADLQQRQKAQQFDSSPSQDLGYKMSAEKNEGKIDLSSFSPYSSNDVYKTLNDGSRVALFKNSMAGTDNAERLAQEQSGWEQLGNGALKALTNVGSVIVGNTAGFVYGVGSMASSGNFNAFYDNSFTRTLDDYNTMLNYQLPNYVSKDEQENGFFTNLVENPGNVVGNDILNGLSFTLGTIASEAIWAYATGGTSLIARAGQKGAQLANAGRWGKLALGSADDAAKGLAGYKGFLNKPIVNLVKTGAISTGQARTLAGVASGINTARFIATSSGNEAGIEAFHFKKEAQENFYNNFESKNGRPPTSEETQEAFKNIEDASTNVFLGNMAILGVSNLAMLGNMFGIKSPLKDFRNAFNKSAFGVGVEKVGETWGKINPTKFQSINRKLYVPVASFVREGLFEEAGQGTVNKIANIWVERKYDPNYINKAIDILDVASEAAKEQYGTKQGWKDIWIGGIVGTIGGAVTGEFSSFKRQDQEIEKGEVKYLNAMDKISTTLVEDITAGRITAVAQQLEAQDRAEKSMLKGDIIQAKLAHYDGLLAGMVMADKYDSSENLLNNLSTSIDASQDISKEDKEIFKESLKGLHKTYKEAESFASAIIGGQGRVKGTLNGTTQEVKESLTYLLVQGNNANELMNETFNDLSVHLNDTNSLAISQNTELMNSGFENVKKISALSKEYNGLEEKINILQRKVAEINARPNEIEGDKKSGLYQLTKQLEDLLNRKQELRNEVENIGEKISQNRQTMFALQAVKEQDVDFLSSTISVDDLLSLDKRIKNLNDSFSSMESLNPSNAQIIKDLMEQYNTARESLVNYNQAANLIAKGDFNLRLANDTIFSKMLGQTKEDEKTKSFYEALVSIRNKEITKLQGKVQNIDLAEIEARLAELANKEQLTEEEIEEQNSLIRQYELLSDNVIDDTPSQEKKQERELELLNSELAKLEEQLDIVTENTISINNLQDFENLSEEKRQELKDNISSKIDSFPDDMFYLIHLTNSKDALDSIMVNGLNTGVAIESTTNAVISNETLKENLFAIIDGKVSHRGSTNLAIMAFPKSIAQTTSYTEEVSNYIAENYPNYFGKSIPAQYSFAFFKDGILNLKNEEQVSEEESTLREEIRRIKKEISEISVEQELQDPLDILRNRVDEILKAFKADFIGTGDIEERLKNRPDQKDIDKYRELLDTNQIETEEFINLNEKLSLWKVYDSLSDDNNESVADLLDKINVLETNVEEDQTETDPTPEYNNDEDLETNKSGKVDNFQLTQNTNFAPTIKVNKQGQIIVTHLKPKQLLDKFSNPILVEGDLNDFKYGDKFSFEDGGIVRTFRISTGMSLEMAKEDFLAIPNVITSNKQTENITNWSYSVLYEVDSNGKVVPMQSGFLDTTITGHSNNLKEGDVVEFYVDVNNEYNKSLKGSDKEMSDSIVIYVRKNGENFQTLKGITGRTIPQGQEDIVSIRKEALKQFKLGKSGVIGTTLVERVELGTPILTLTDNGAITTMPITEQGLQNVETTGYVQDGELFLSKNINDVRKSYVSKNSKRNKNIKTPIVVIKQGKQFIAFPVKVVKSLNPQGQKMMDIFNSDLEDAKKVVKINELLIENRISPKKFNLVNITEQSKLEEIEKELNKVENFRTADDLADKSYKKENLINDVQISLDLEDLGKYIPSQKLLISFEDINLSKQKSNQKIKEETKQDRHAVNALNILGDHSEVIVTINNQEELDKLKSKGFDGLGFKIGQNAIIVDSQIARKINNFFKEKETDLEIKPYNINSYEFKENQEDITSIEDGLSEKRVEEIADMILNAGVEYLDKQMMSDYLKDKAYIDRRVEKRKAIPKTVVKELKSTKNDIKCP